MQLTCKTDSNSLKFFSFHSYVQIDVEIFLKPTASELPVNSKVVIAKAWYPVFFQVILDSERTVS